MENNNNSNQLYEEGNKLYLEKEYDKAIVLIKEAAELGNSDAQELLGICYYTGRGIVYDFEKCLEWLKKSALQGNPKAAYLVGLHYYQGVGVQKNLKEAYKWHTIAANKGNMNSMFSMAVINLASNETWNEEEAINLFKQSASLGNPSAILALGEYYYGKLLGKEVDMEEAMKYFRKAAELGNAKAQTYLGKALLMGKGVDNNEEEGLAFLKKAVEGHDEDWEASLTLAKYYFTKKEYKEALKYLSSPTEDGFPEAEYLTGQLYLEGKGVEQNTRKALSHIKSAAEQGNTKAEALLGLLYLYGKKEYEISVDLSEAARWLEKAANKDDEQSELLLVDMNLNIVKNFGKAKKWLEKIASRKKSDGIDTLLQKMGELSI